MRGHAHRQRLMRAAQPARAGRLHGYQVSDRLRASFLQLPLLVGGQRLQIARKLVVVRGDEDQPLALRPLFQLEQAQHRPAVVRVTAQPVAGFCRIGD